MLNLTNSETPLANMNIDQNRIDNRIDNRPYKETQLTGKPLRAEREALLEERDRAHEFTDSDDAAFVAQLADKIERYQRQVDDLQRKISGLRKAYQSYVVPGPSNPTDQVGAVEVPKDFGRRKRERKESKAYIVRRQAFAILKTAGRPLGRAELFDKLKDRGVIIDSKNPAKLVGKILWEASEFEHTDEGYWIVGEPIISPSGEAGVSSETARDSSQDSASKKTSRQDSKSTQSLKT